MSRSKNARRRARANGLTVPYAKMIPVTNWMVGSQAVTNAGQVIGGLTTPTSIATWNPIGGLGTFNLVSGVPVTYQAAVIQPGLTGAIPAVGRIRIDEIKGRIHFTTPSINSYYSVAVGIYVSEFTVNTSAWDVYDPLLPNEGARDDWFFLESMILCMIPAATSTADSCFFMDLKIPTYIVIGGGQALHVTVSMVESTGSGRLVCAPAFRTRVGPVA